MHFSRVQTLSCWAFTMMAGISSAIANIKIDFLIELFQFWIKIEQGISSKKLNRSTEGFYRRRGGISG